MCRIFVFFFKQKTAYEMRISDWSSDVCSSDLYVLAAASPTHPVSPAAYHRGWVQSLTFRNDRPCYDIRLPLGPDFGGPLFFAHYSFLGLDPPGLRDRYAAYWQPNVRSEERRVGKEGFSTVRLRGSPYN